MKIGMGKEKKVTSNETINLKVSDEAVLQSRAAYNIDEDLRRFAKDFYENVKKNPDIWRSSARMFKRVADLVLIEVDKDEDRRPSQASPLNDIYVFLMSVAIENILKGILMASGRMSYEDVTTTHNIDALYVEYCEWFGLPVAEDEELLSILTYAAIWVGRFNLPTRSKDLEDAFEKHGFTLSYINDGLSISLPSGELKATREKINASYERLYAKFEEVVAAGQ